MTFLFKAYVADNLLLYILFAALKNVVRASRILDEMISQGRADNIPRNVLAAIESRFSVYTKISISFPKTFPPGDGDGLSRCELVEVHDLFCGENVIRDNFSCSFHQKLNEMKGQDVRCRLVGFDTQETDLPVVLKNSNASRLVGVPQPFAKMGTDFLVGQLAALKGDKPSADTILECDCFGIDLYGRLLVDVRSVRNRADTPLRPPLFGRFKMAERFLENGVAHPTYGGYTDERLLRAFAKARENSKGAFGDPEKREFVHPSVYRNARRSIVADLRKRNRPPYSE